MTRVLFVCLGNICRSPTAEAVFRKQVEDAGLSDFIQVDSAGTGDWHVGSGPDRRAIQKAALRGYDLASLRARQVDARDFQRFDYVLAMDRSNLSNLKSFRADERGTEPRLFLEFASAFDALEVPDPYYGGDEGFEEVLDLIEDASRGLLHDIQKRSRARSE